VVDKRWDLDASTTLLRRIWFWNLSYTMSGLNHVIDCPTVSINDILTTWADAETPDIWNATQVYKDFINLFDLTSMYDEDFWGETGNQNDSVYVFSIMVTDMDDYWDMYFPAPPDDLPDNVLLFAVYETPDGTNNLSDEMLIRWDTDNDGDYEATDVAMWTNDTLTMFYEGWTPVDEAEVFEHVVMLSGASTSTNAGAVFRDSLYWYRAVIINWDTMYNGSSGARIGDDTCRMSMMFYDNDTDSIAVLQDFYPGDDDAHYANTDGRNKSWDPMWFLENTSDFWTLFTIDTGISGEPLSDPVDPVESVGLEIVVNIWPVLAAVVFLVILIGMLWSQTLTVESLVAWLVVAVTAIIAVWIMTSI
jgi:hypothetical protein